MACKDSEVADAVMTPRRGVLMYLSWDHQSPLNRPIMLIRNFKLDIVCDEAAKWWLAVKFGRVAVFGYCYPIEY